jgi:hypothetical protein
LLHHRVASGRYFYTERGGHVGDFIAAYWQEGLFAAIVAIFTGLYRRLQKKVKKELCDQKNIKDGMLALLRSELIRQHEKYTERHWIPVYAMDNFNELYNAYHELGGNGTVTKLKKELEELPSTKPSE